MNESDQLPPNPPVPLLERLRFVQRQTTLLFVLMAVTVAAFFLTRALAARARTLHEADAAQWHTLGRHRLAGGDAAGAITALRRAAAGDRDNLEVQLALAGAYLAAGQAGEGRDVLLEFRERHPDHPEVNLRLARLEASGEQPDDAIRFYQAALLGLWGPEQLEQRRTLRIEYIGFLLDRKLSSRALSETLLLAGEMPDDVASHVRLGELMRRSGDPARALAQFESALALDRRHPDATARAGEAAFEIGSYRLADRYLRQVPRDPRSRSLRPVLELIVALDPLLPGLPSVERQRRVASAAGRLETEVLECRARRCQSADAACAEVEALAREVTVARAQLKKNGRKNDAADPGSSMVVGLAEKASALCGPDAAIFRALSLIAARHATPP